MSRPLPLPEQTEPEGATSIEPKWIMPADGIWVPVEHEITRAAGLISDRRCTDLERFKADMEADLERDSH